MRIGTPILTKCGMGVTEMDVIAMLVDRALPGVEILGEREYRVDEDLREEIREEVRGLCREFPLQ
jgi:glycine/serine hydroxymethyltransferase